MIFLKNGGNYSAPTNLSARGIPYKQVPQGINYWLNYVAILGRYLV